MLGAVVTPVAGQAVPLLRSFVGLVALVCLAGCSSTFFGPSDKPFALDPGPMEYQAVVSKYLEAMPNRATMGPFEISPLRETRLAQPGDWIVCVKTTVEQRPTYLALFIHDNAVVDRRLAVLVDDCPQQRFQPLPAEAKPPPKP
jgi:hypothetical protein